MANLQKKKLLKFFQKHARKLKNSNTDCEIPAELLGTVNIKAKNSNREARLLYAIKQRHHKNIIMKLLKEDGIILSINQQDNEGYAALHTVVIQAANDNKKWHKKQYELMEAAWDSDYSILNSRSNIPPDITILTSLLDQPATDVNIMDSQGMTALMYFSIRNLPTTETDGPSFKEVFMKLLKRPDVEINAVDYNGMSAFLYAIQQKKLEVFLALLDHPNLELNLGYNITVSNLLHKATALQFTLYQYEIKPEKTVPPIKPVTSYLVFNCEKEQISTEVQMIASLVSHNRFSEDINLSRTLQGFNTMHLLIKHGHFQAINKFLSNKEVHTEFPHIDPFQEDDNGISVWEALCMSHQCRSKPAINSRYVEINIATSLPQIETALTQLVNGAESDINKQDGVKRTMLHFLCIYGINKVVSHFLTRKDFNLNLQDKEGHTALMHAVGKLDAKTIGEFLNHPGCDLQLRNMYEQTVQTISDSKEPNQLDPRVRSLITAAFEKSSSKPTKTEIVTELGIAEQLILLKKSFERDPFFTKEEKERFFTQIEGIESDVQVNRGIHPVPQDSMSDVHTRKLLKKRVYLCDELTPKEVFDYLIQDDILKEDKVEEIKLEGTRRGMCQKLLSILPRCGKNAYLSLIKALNESGQCHIAKELETFNPDEDPQNQTAEGTMQLFGNQGLISGNHFLMSQGHGASVMVPVQIRQDGVAFMTIPLLNVGNGST